MSSSAGVISAISADAQQQQQQQTSSDMGVTPAPLQWCHRCALAGTLRCGRCRFAFYCSRDCQKADWAEHRIACRPPLTHIDTPNDATSLRESKLRPELWAHAFSFLSHYQSSVASRVNHCWLVASQLPTAASAEPLHISSPNDVQWLHMPPHVRRQLVTLVLEGSTPSPPPPPLPRLRELGIRLEVARHSDPTPTIQAWSSWWQQTPPSSLTSLRMPAWLLGTDENRIFASMPQLQQLYLLGMMRQPSMIDALAQQLQRLELADICVVVSAFADDDGEESSGRRLLRQLATLPVLRSLSLNLDSTSHAGVRCICHPPDLLGIDAPQFTKLTHLDIGVLPSDISSLRHIGRCAPVLESLRINVLDEFSTLSPAGRSALVGHVVVGLAAVRDSLRRISLRILGDRSGRQQFATATMREAVQLMTICPRAQRLVITWPAVQDFTTAERSALLRQVVLGMPHLQEMDVTLDSHSIEDLHTAMRLVDLTKLIVRFRPGYELPTGSPTAAPSHPAPTKIQQVIFEDSTSLQTALPLLLHMPRIASLRVWGSTMRLAALFELAQHRPIALRCFSSRADSARAGAPRVRYGVLTVDTEFFEQQAAPPYIDLRHPVAGHTLCAAYREAMQRAATAESITTSRRFDSLHADLNIPLPRSFRSGVDDVVCVGVHLHRLYYVSLTDGTSDSLRAMRVIFREYAPTEEQEDRQR